MKYTEAYVAKVVKYVAEGHSCKKASEKFDVSVPTVYYWVKAFRANDNTLHTTDEEVMVNTPKVSRVTKTKKTVKAKPTNSATTFITCRVSKKLKQSLKHWALDNGKSLQETLAYALEQIVQ